MSATGPLRRAIPAAFPDRPFEIELWDGTEIAATAPGAPRFRVRSPDALAYALRAPGQLGVGRAYVRGALEIDDLEAVMRMLDTWRPRPPGPRERARLAFAALAAAGWRPRPVPEAELQLTGERHSRTRDARAVRHHYDVSNEFFALFLDASMTYSCGVWRDGAQTLEQAQEAKLELVCRKLALAPGDRVLDVGCGWGSFAVHAATRHGAEVTGITLSPRQAELARERVRQAGVEDRVEIRVADYRDLGGGGDFDAIASIGMVEHVGEAAIDRYGQSLAALLKPGGRLLNHGIARLRHSDAPAGPFSDRYVFPDAEPLHLSRVLLALERAGFETHHVEGFREDYAITLRHWAQRLDADPERARRLAGEERLRVWRLYLRAARNGFLNGFTSVYQVRATLPGDQRSAAGQAMR